MSQPERPSFIANWRDIENDYAWQYDEDDEPMCIGTAFGRHFGLNKLGIHHERLLPGRRTSFPHAESAEEEFVFVIEGEPDVWIDGHLHRLGPGDAVGFPAGTGIAHSFQYGSRGPPACGGRNGETREPHILPGQSRAQATAYRLVGRSS